MKTRFACISILSCAALALVSCAGMQSATNTMSFFVTSVGSGKGADLGGLAGADGHCQSLAQAAGAGGRTWRAYLSTQGKDGVPTVNARDRIGKGPWYNAKGELIARDVDHLHSAGNNVTKQTALNEKGQVVAGRNDQPANRHDILTGSRADGTAFAAADPDLTCGNWTRSRPATGRRHGTRRTSRGAAAGRLPCAAPAATACSTASPPIDLPRRPQRSLDPVSTERPRLAPRPFFDFIPVRYTPTGRNSAQSSEPSRKRKQRATLRLWA